MQGDKNDGGDNGVDSPGVNRIVQFSATEDQINPRGIPTPPGTPPSSSSPITPSKSPRLGAKSLRANLTRELRDKDPLFYYEVISVLGTGSMGSVLKVRKKDAVKGGSARQKLLGHFRRERLWRKCFSLPLLGGILQYFLGSAADTSLSVVSTSSNGLGGETEESVGKDIVYAMKSIHLSRVTDPAFIDELKNEISILRTLDHPHIIKAMEMFEHRQQLFIVMELCTGGDLYSRDPYTEEEAARLVRSILSAISYMHSKNIAHRDLKYENILFVDSSPKSEIKLIDFGLSSKFGNEDLTEGVGTIYTMAPEVLKGKYTKQADLWSVGVIAYMLLSSQMPFYGKMKKQIAEKILKGKYDFKGRRWKRVSQQAKSFVDDLLVVDPEERLTAEQASYVFWLNRGFRASVRNPDLDDLQSAKECLRNFANYSNLNKVALMIVAHKSTSAQIGILRKVFQKYDTDHSGQLSYEEFKAAIADAGYAEDDYRNIFDAVDLDGTGHIRYTEFLAATIEAQGVISEERLAEAFDRIDADDSGFITSCDLRNILGHSFPQEEISRIMEEAGANKSNKISYSQFLAHWEKQKETNRSEAMKEVRTLENDFLKSEEPSELPPSPLASRDSRVNFLEEKFARRRSGSTTPLFIPSLEELYEG